MDFYGFLNKKLENTDYKETVRQKVDNKEIKSENKTDNDVVFEDKSIFNNASKEEVDKIDYNKLLTKYEDMKEDTKLSPLEFIMKEFFSFDDVKNKVDKNSDGEISEEEAKNYMKELAGMDGDDSKLSIEDFTKALNKYKIDLEKELEKFNDNNTTATAITEPIVENNFPAPQMNTYVPSFETDYSAAVPSGGYYNSGYQAATPVEKTIETMSLDELKEEKTKRETTLSEKQTALENAKSGNTETLKAAKADVDKAQKAYTDALDKDKAAEPFKNDIKKNLENIAKNKEDANKNSIAISKQEDTVAKQEETVKAAENILNALVESLKSISKKTGDPEKDKKIDEKVKEIQTKINSQKQEVEKQKKELEKQKSTLKKLEEEKTKIEKTKNELEKKKAELEARVEKECSQATKDALKAFNEATKKYETTKEAEIKAAKEEVETAKKAVLEVNEKINVAEANKVKAENSLTPVMDINNIPAADVRKYGIRYETMHDGTKVLAVSWSQFNMSRPEWQDMTKYMLQAAQEKGMTLVYSDVGRTKDQSNAGRARKGSMVCKGGESPHNYGVAADIVVYKNGHAVSVNSGEYKEFVNRAVQLSGGKIDCGVYWRKKNEQHHFEIRGWRSTYKRPQYLVG